MDPAVAIEVGTSRVRVLVGEMREDGLLRVFGLGEAASRGVKKSEIIHLDHAVACIREAMDQADRHSNVAINSVLVSLSGGDMRWQISRGTIPIFGPDDEITPEDVEHVIETGRAVSLPPDREVVHSIKQHFFVDDHEGVIDPEGMAGAQLAVDMLILHGVRNRLKQTVRAVKNSRVEVDQYAFSGLCSALACLSPEQKESGALVIDLGGGTTDYCVYANQTLAMAGTVAVGGDHVTNDLAMGLGITNRQAEKLKMEHGCATVDYNVRRQTLSLAAEAGFSGRSIQLLDVHQIVHARMDETLRLVKAQLDQKGLTPLLGAGVILTGGGARMKRISECAGEVFGVRCAIGKPRGVSGLAVATEGPEWASLVGMLRYYFKMEQKADAAETIGGVLRGLFGRKKSS